MYVLYPVIYTLNIMSTSSYFISDHTFSTLNSYSPSDSSSSYIAINGTTILLNTQRVPLSASDTGVAGEVCFGVSGGVCYIYYCVIDNAWVRAALSTF